MFGKKKSTSLGQDVSNLQELAGQLGVERRRAIRVRYPSIGGLRLPRLANGGAGIDLFDISTGGCCALDPAEILGTKVGIKSEVQLTWNDGKTETVGVRIVSRVDQRVHIQFLNLAASREEQIKSLIVTGARGQWVKMHHKDERTAQVHVQAKELWSSPYGDSVVICEDVHKLAQVTVYGIEHTFYREAWPVKTKDTPLSVAEVDDLSLFLCNIPAPSDWLLAIATHADLLVRGPEGESR